MLHEIFEKIANEYPDLPVVQFEADEALTYQEINKRADNLANLLAERGITVGSDVAVMIKRSPNILVTLLACSKLGAVYVPIDPKCPPKRIKAILNDLNPAITLTDSGVLKKFDFIEKESKAIVALGTLAMGIELSTKDNSPPPLKANNELIAYLMYTSGTTGVPKGVPIKHSGLHYWFHILQRKINSLETQEDEASSASNDHGESKTPSTQISQSKTRVLSFISQGFDASIWEFLMAWAGNGTNYMVSDATRDNIQALVRFLKQHKVTHATLLPTLLRFILPELPELHKSGLAHIFSTGEELTRDISEACQTAGVRLDNAYGPTEATFGMVSEECRPEEFQDEDDKAPIKPPYGEVKYVILNESGEPVKEGEEGELYIISPHLSPGYRNRLKETAANFKEITFEGEIVRAYATKDRFRQYGDNLYYYGRLNVDSHVKIHGIFVNPAETTERILASQKDQGLPIQDAKVVVVDSEHVKNPYLVAFIVLQTALKTAMTHPAIIKQLRTYLLGHLATAAMPSRFHVLEKFPVTVNGKTDVKALKAQAESLKKEEKAFTPKTFLLELERQIFELWDKILPGGTESINTDTAFAFVGGDSIRVLRLTDALNKTFKLEIEVGELFTLKPLSISQLASLVATKQLEKDKEHKHIRAVFNSKSEKPGIFIFHHITGEATMTYTQLANQLKSLNMPIYAVNSRNFVDSGELCTDIDIVAEDYARGIISKDPHGPYVLLGWSFGANLAYKVAEKLEEQGKKVAFLGLIDGIAPAKLQALSLEELAEEYLDLFARLQKSIPIQAFQLSLTNTQILEAIQQKKIETPSQLVRKIFYHTTCKDKKGLKILHNVAAFLIANRNFKPQPTPLQVIPTVFACQETAEKYASLQRKTSVVSDSKEERGLSLGWGTYQKVYSTDSVVGQTHEDAVTKPDILTQHLEKEIMPLIEQQATEKERLIFDNPFALMQSGVDQRSLSLESQKLLKQFEKFTRALSPTNESSPPKEKAALTRVMMSLLWQRAQGNGVNNNYSHHNGTASNHQQQQHNGTDRSLSHDTEEHAPSLR